MDCSGSDASSRLSAAAGRNMTIIPASDDVPPPPASARVKLMVSYGGRIQLRPHDNTRLTYVGGETKILVLDRSARLSSLLAKLTAVVPSAPDPLCLKYQLPGEELDALVSVTDDDDIEHMMVEHDRLQRNSSSPKMATRLRLFLFPISPPPPPPSAALLDSARSDRQWFLDALNAVPIPPKQPSSSPDFLFGLDEGFVPSPAVKVALDAHPPSVPENLTFIEPTKADPAKEVETSHKICGGSDPPVASQAGFSAAEIQRQIPERCSFEINLPPKIPRNSSKETLHRVSPAEYQVPPLPEKNALSAAQWPDTTGRYASLAPGHEQTLYLVPAATGICPRFYAATPRIAPAQAYHEAAAAAKAVVGGGGLRTGTKAHVEGGKLAYDSAGRVVYYASAVPKYQTVTSVALNPLDAAVKAAKPSQTA